MTTLRLSAIDSVTHLCQLRVPWNELMLFMPGVSVFQSFGWTMTWWRHFGRPRHLSCVIVQSGRSSDILAILPLMQSRLWYCGIPTTVVSLVGGEMIDQGGGVARPDCPHVLAAALSASRRAHPGSMFRLRLLRSEMALYLGLGTAGDSAGYTESHAVQSVCCPLGDSWEAQERQLPAGLRSDLHRASRRLSATPDSTCQAFVGPACAQHFDSIAAVEAASRRYLRKGVRFAIGPRKEWLYDMFHTDTADLGGPAILALLFAEGRPIGYSLTWTSSETAHLYQTAFDDRYAHLSPGHLMIAETMRVCISMGIPMFSFGRGAELYKRKWSPERHVLSVYTLFGAGRAQHCRYVHHRTIERLSRDVNRYYDRVPDRRPDKLLAKALWARLSLRRG